MTSEGVEDGGTVRAAGRRDGAVVLLVAGTVLFSRLAAALWVGPARRVLDDDEAVYFTAGALVGRGGVPYRDVTLAQPPGIAYLLALPSRWWSVLDALTVARCMAAVAGAACVYLVGRLAVRRYSPAASVAAMAAMATFPAAAVADRSILVEPWLNLCTLGAAVVWLGGAERTGTCGPASRPAALLAGAVLGLAVVMKWWAVLLLVPMAATLAGRRWTELARAAGAAACTAGLLLLPVLVVAPADFLQQAVRYQSLRGDGPAMLDRVGPVFGVGASGLALRGLLPTLVAVVALVLLVVRRDHDPVLRFGLVWFGVLTVTFLSGPYLGLHYTAHLAPALGLMAAPVADVLVGAWTTRHLGGRVAALTVGGVLFVVVLNGARWVRGDAIATTAGPVSFAARLRAADGAVWSPSPELALLAGRIPGLDQAGRFVADPLASTAPGAYRQAPSRLVPRGFDLAVVGPTDGLDRSAMAAAGLVLVAADPTAQASLWEPAR